MTGRQAGGQGYRLSGSRSVGWSVSQSVSSPVISEWVSESRSQAGREADSQTVSQSSQSFSQSVGQSSCPRDTMIFLSFNFSVICVGVSLLLSFFYFILFFLFCV